VEQVVQVQVEQVELQHRMQLQEQRFHIRVVEVDQYHNNVDLNQVE
tara:strand:+ start:209 stop:346 length:138 start_codon:yes stop_codon:yes gene_type:complete